MAFDPTRAAIRFGTGLSPRLPAPDSTAAMLAELLAPDEMARRHPIPAFAAARPGLAEWRAAQRAFRQGRGKPGEAAARGAYDALRRDAAALGRRGFMASLARGIEAPQGGLRERLSWFWADHFTVRSRQPATRHLVTPYVEEAIRPHVSGRFETMLIAVTTHPMMLGYLDQSGSVGPGSKAAQPGDGLNENLARELLELHTVGVGGPYAQADVRELAELLTGLGAGPRGMRYRRDRAEPGAETVLGTRFDAAPRLGTIHDALRMLARHPATAAHLARKIAVHFVADDPDPALVAALEAAWRDSDGDLGVVTGALLAHPAAWSSAPGKVKPPFDFVVSGLRALGLPSAALRADRPRWMNRVLRAPLERMGQGWEQPPGPDGWPETAAAWITPPGMAGRIDWAMTAPEALMDRLPDPRDFARAALGETLPEPVAFAARAAESRAEAIGVVLSAPAFQRR
ncbi:DUF1800 domain-containing protein [Limimaricola hongkongensis]|uniref:DUF1800 domain-containing protein n=1 Tax=Limimaricola hongkongensis TaxID=278132 RepID=UPI0004758534|nr:DUF1800 domain-containing protein [Limimaricola hongkongensis]